MLTLDHIPFYAGELVLMRAGFEGLGFQVTPTGSYRSPQYPATRWKNCCVFMDENWCDLIASDAAAHAQRIKAGACLLRTDDLSASIERLRDVVDKASRYQLVRRWDDDQGVPQEHFDLVALSQKVCPLQVSIIQHHYPCLDTKREWFEHSNGARGLIGVVFPRDAAVDLPESLQRAGEPWLEYADSARFSRRYGAGTLVAVRVRVRSLAVASKVIQRNGISCVAVQNAVIVRGASRFTCSWEFVE